MAVLAFPVDLTNKIGKVLILVMSKHHMGARAVSSAHMVFPVPYDNLHTYWYQKLVLKIGIDFKFLSF